ncbi:MAG: GTPase Era [Eubacteriaceae bacterium]|jgi:GTP-binding protein Era
MTDNKNFKSGFVSIIGRPNVGKSTLLNRIMGEKLVITSDKPQTTRNAIRCIHTDDQAQMIFIDTPGITRSKNKLGDYMVKAAENTFADVDAVVYIIEPDQKPGPGDKHILELVNKTRRPVILAINKIDTIPKEEILGVINNWKDLAKWTAIIPISASKGDGTGELLDVIRQQLSEGPKYFPEDMVMDQPERFIVSELIREKILRLLKNEVPHGIAVEIDSMKPRKGKDLIDIEATVFCERKTHKGILIGKNGSMLKKIGSQARRDIEFFLKQPVNLQIFVKVRENWRDRPFDLGELGYKEQK